MPYSDHSGDLVTNQEHGVGARVVQRDVGLYIKATHKTATIAAPAVLAYKLAYEPLLYITDAKGVLVNRLDAVFDVTEMSSALAAVGIS